jgi:SAM-dependent methyltransferase
VKPDPVIPAFDAERCALYLAGNEGAPPREQLVAALALPRAPGVPMRALDIGCGPGREVRLLLERGFEVVAVDPYAQMLKLSRAEAAAVGAEARVEFVHATLEEFAPRLRDGEFGVVHAGFALPFVQPAAFDQAFGHVRRSLAAGGLLAAQFFGHDDEFRRTSPAGSLSTHAREDVERLLAGFEVLAHDEVNREGRMGRGRAKWWHVHHVIARRRG